MPEIACASCGKSFRVSAFRAAYGRKFCSRDCYSAAHGKGMNPRSERVALTCKQCGEEFHLTRYRATGRQHCSASCAGKSRVHILNAVRRSPKEYARPPVSVGPKNPMWVPPVTHRCDGCGQDFQRKPFERARNKGTEMFCSRSCRDKHRREHKSGENSPHWVGGAQTYRGRNWKRIRLVVVDAQNGCCAECGKHVGASLPIHHKRPFREFATAEEANRQANLIGLCQSCHMKHEWAKAPQPEQAAVHP